MLASPSIRFDVYSRTLAVVGSAEDEPRNRVRGLQCVVIIMLILTAITFALTTLFVAHILKARLISY